MSDWKLPSDQRRKLFRRYVDLQMRHVHEEVFKYVSEVRSDLCINDIMDDIPDLMYHSFYERPRDPKAVEEMLSIHKLLTEKKDGPTDEIDSLSKPEQAGFN